MIKSFRRDPQGKDCSIQSFCIPTCRYRRPASRDTYTSMYIVAGGQMWGDTCTGRCEVAFCLELEPRAVSGTTAERPESILLNDQIKQHRITCGFSRTNKKQAQQPVQAQPTGRDTQGITDDGQPGKQ